MALLRRRTLRLLVAGVAIVVMAGLADPAQAQGGSEGPTAPSTSSSAGFSSPRLTPPLAPSGRPPHFRQSAGEVIARARAAPEGRAILRENPTALPIARAPDLGLWRVSFERAGRVVGVVEIEDRTGRVLDGGAWSWPQVTAEMGPAKRQMETILLALGAVFLAFLIDWRRPLSWRTLDGLVLVVGFGAAFALADRGRALLAYPLVYPPLVYLAARLVIGGLRGPTGGAPWRPPRVSLLGPALVLLVAFRVAYNLLEGHVNDVGYAGVAGADAILHGFGLYAQDANHLDTYGPIAYLAHVPATLLFPMDAGWSRDGLAAAHVTAVVCDLATLALLVVMGRRLRPGRDGLRLGLGLAVLFAACPWTFFPLAMSANDGLLALLLVATLVALRSAPLRGVLLGLAAATKFSPAALLPLIAAGGRPSRSGIARCAGAFTVVLVVAALAYVPDGGLPVLWHETVGFQLRRRSFLSLWGQYPELEPLQQAIKGMVIVLSVALAVRPRKRDLAQVAALAAAIMAALQLTVVYWSFFYLGWLAPLMLVAVVLREERAPAGEVERAATAAIRRRALAASRTA